MCWAEAVRRWEAGAPRLVKWWNAQDSRVKIAVAAATVLTAASILNLAGAGIGRLLSSGRPVAAVATVRADLSAPPLVAEAAPTDAGGTWTVRGVWQGSGRTETEAFVVGEHWRVDSLFDPASTAASLQVFVYHADGRLLMTIAANTQKAGADTSFWAGPGRYFLKINSSGGDWKVDVQDLR